MTPSQPETPTRDLAALWASARQLYPIYAEMAREFAIDAAAPAELEAEAESPTPEAAEQAQRWFSEIDEHSQVHQLRQFLQTSTAVDADGIVLLVKRLLSAKVHSDAMRDKVDFLLVQYFSQIAPTDLQDERVDLAYVAQQMEPILGSFELKTPVWLNALDRVVDSARRCRSLDELLHGGVLEQGRKAKGQAGELFYMPVALAAFTRFGYLMRRAFFRLMLADLNNILDGLGELEAKGVETIDCRRAQFSAQEPIVRLRMICQSWKVMFQAEYSSGQPLRMLVDLRASVESALGRGEPAKGAAKGPVKKTAGTVAAKPTRAAAAVAGAKNSASLKTSATLQAEPMAKPSPKKADAGEFEIAGAPAWNPEGDSKTGQ
jgi:hypothetical protein